jgi:hypothetical protein
LQVSPSLILKKLNRFGHLKELTSEFTLKALKAFQSSQSSTMSLEIFARQSLAHFCIIYKEIFDDKAIHPSELETLMWGRMCAKDAGINKTGFKIPYDNIKRAKVILPFMPDDINYTGCCAIKKNGGLYTPCCGKVADDGNYCKSCSVTKEGEVKELEFGDIDSRALNVENEQFAPITFAEWMKGHKTTLPEVYAKLREAGIALEVPANELICRELPKRRKGRPAKSEDSVVDEDTVPKKSKAKSPAASGDEAPKAKKTKAKVVKAESDSESESEVEAPKAKKAKSPAASEDEAPKAKAKAKKAEASDEKPKAKKAKSPAASEDEAPKKAKKAKEPESVPKAKKVKSPAASDDEEPKTKKASSDSESDTPKKAKKAKTPEPVPEPEVLDIEDAEEEDQEDQEIEIGGKDYTLRNGKFICDKDDGRILGTVNDEGEAEWTEEP